jgi:hypothetical protein
MPRRAPRQRAGADRARAAVLGLAFAVGGCWADQSEGGSAGMFSLFEGKKAAQAVTAVHAEVGAGLVRAASFPAAPAPALVAEVGRCTKVAVERRPPAASFVGQAVAGRSAVAYRVAGVTGQPPLALVNRGGRNPSFALWELGTEAQPNFTRSRAVKLDPAQAAWVGFQALGVACLPARQLLLAVQYTEPEARDALYVYDMVGNAFRALGRIEPDTSAGPPFKYFDTLAAGRQAVLVRYGSDAQRLAAEVYVNRLNRVLLFSAHHPQGLEVLKLAVDDGNIRRWALQGKTLWLATVDERVAGKQVNQVWSLDLSRLLP